MTNEEKITVDTFSLSVCILGGGMHVHMYGEARGQHCLLKIISPLHILETVCRLKPGSYCFGLTDWSLRDPPVSVSLTLGLHVCT